MTASASPLKPGDHLYLVDGSGFLFRAYHALPPLTRKKDGLPIGAVSGYCNMLWKLLCDMNGEMPTHMAVIFDAARKTFRNDIYPAYKANRPPAPEDLVPQFSLVRDATRAFSVACIEEPGYEADDLIATYARIAHEAGARTTIVSSDKDLMQLVKNSDAPVNLFDAMKSKWIGIPEVQEKFGVAPDRVIDIQALAGDAVDNVPGVPGIGIKTAATLINTYGDLEGLLAHASEIKQPKRREKLMENAEAARISYRLVKLKDDAPLPAPVEDMAVQDVDGAKALAFLKDMELNTLARRLAQHFWADGEVPEVPATQAVPAEPADITPVLAATEAVSAPEEPGKPADGPAAPTAEPVNPDTYETVTTKEALQRWIDRAHEAGHICVDTETTSLDALQAGLCGVSLALGPNDACYIPCGHKSGNGGFDLGETIEQMDEAELIALLKPLLEDDSVLKIGQNLKYDYLIFRQRGIVLSPIDDTMLMSYVLDAGLHGHGMDELSELHLGHTPIPFSEVAGKGKAKVTFDQVPVKDATRYSGEDADVTLRLWNVLKPRLAADRKTTVYETLERPLMPVLAEIERNGIKVDVDQLRKLSNDFALEQAELEKQIHQAAGEPFNVGSPKQLGEILFGKLGLKGGKKTKTGAWSTDAKVLDELAAQGEDLPKKILEWRELSKLRGTYTDALQGHINPDTGRVHTSFAMAAAATGRLASTDPNLQNIPVRTSAGRRIRQAFIAEPGHKLVSADYSQIELRLLAHVADIDALKHAFAEGIDIHAMTASEIFGIPVEGMPAEIRRRAKAINFGIVYGISAFGLSNQLGIPRSDASDYIKRYFERFPGIQTYMEETKKFAHEHGYVETLFGRRIHVREIDSKNAAFRAGAERAAINAPIQGSAADVIKRAMIRMPDAIKDAGLDAKVLLQVHDELVFEIPEDQAEATCALARKVMENAAEPAQQLNVKLTVEARAADDWDAAH